jgi:hypothetical protein
MTINTPFGSMLRLAVVAFAALAAFTFGQFFFFGLEFLPHLPLSFDRHYLNFLLFSGAWGALIEYMIWNQTRPPAAAARRSPWRNRTAAFWTAAIFVVLLGLWGITHKQYQCLLITTTPLPLAVFAVTVLCQFPIVSFLRAARGDGAAFAALLPFGAVMMFLQGESFAIDHFRKGLEHFQKDHAGVWSIATSDKREFVVDYERKEFLLKTRDGTANILRRSFSDFVCN